MVLAGTTVTVLYPVLSGVGQSDCPNYFDLICMCTMYLALFVLLFPNLWSMLLEQTCSSSMICKNDMYLTDFWEESSGNRYFY